MEALRIVALATSDRSGYITSLRMTVTRIRTLTFALASVVLSCFGVSFVSAQSAANAEVSDVVVAGESLKFTVNLDVAPNFNGGAIQWSLIGPDISISGSVDVPKGK